MRYLAGHLMCCHYIPVKYIYIYVCMCICMCACTSCCLGQGARLHLATSRTVGYVVVWGLRLGAGAVGRPRSRLAARADNICLCNRPETRQRQKNTKRTEKSSGAAKEHTYMYIVYKNYVLLSV